MEIVRSSEAKPWQAREALIEAASRHCPGVDSLVWRFLRADRGPLRMAAVEVLGIVAGKRSVPVLLEALNSPQHDLQLAGFRGFVRLGAAGLSALSRVVADSALGGRILVGIGGRTARKILGGSWRSISDPLAVAFLPERLRKKWYRRHLRRLAESGNVAEEEAALFWKSLDVWAITADRAAAPYLMLALGHGGILNRRRVLRILRVLAQMRVPEASTVFATFLGSHDASVRDAAATGLGLLGNPQAVTLLASQLRPSIPARYLRAARALGLTGRSEAVSALIPHLKWTGKLGQTTALALAVLLREKGRFLHGPGAGRVRRRALAILRGIVRKKGDPRRWWALDALALARDSDAVGQGLRLLGSKKPNEALAGCLALDGWGGRGEVAHALVRRLDASDERLAACAAWVLRDSDQVAVLAKAAASAKPMVSWNAAAALAASRAAKSVLGRLAGSLDHQVATVALVGLARQGKRNVEDLAIRFSREDDDLRRQALVWAMVRTDPGRAAVFLRELSWRFVRFGSLQPPWLPEMWLAAKGMTSYRSSDDFVVVSFEGDDVGGMPARVLCPDGTLVWWFADPTGTLARTGLVPGRMEVRPGRLGRITQPVEPSPKGERPRAGARPRSRAGTSSRPHSGAGFRPRLPHGHIPARPIRWRRRRP